MHVGGEKNDEYPRAEVTGGCEIPDVGAETHTCVLLKSSKSS